MRGELTIGDRVKLDAKDKKILEQLQLNARQSIAQIAKKTSLPRDVVVYRIKKLEKSNVIRRHHTSLNPSKLGYPLYAYVTFACYNLEPKQEEAFIKYLVAQQNTVYVAKTSGNYDFTIGVCARDYREYDSIITEIRRRFTRVIKDIATQFTIQEYKFDWMTDLISESNNKN